MSLRVLLAAAMILSITTGCERKKTTGEKVEDKIEDTGDKVGDAVDKVEDKVDDAADKVKEETR
jgi:hypothetical protein